MLNIYYAIECEKGFLDIVSNTIITIYCKGVTNMDNEKRRPGRPRNTYEQTKAAKKKQQSYIAQWESENYDKVLIRFPSGTKARIQATGDSVNGFTVRAVLDKLKWTETLLHSHQSDDTNV